MPSRRAAPRASSGARNVESILSRSLLPQLSVEVLNRLAEGQTIGRVFVSTDPSGAFTYALN